MVSDQKIPSLYTLVGLPVSHQDTMIEDRNQKGYHRTYHLRVEEYGREVLETVRRTEGVTRVDFFKHLIQAEKKHLNEYSYKNGDPPR